MLFFTLCLIAFAGSSSWISVESATPDQSPSPVLAKYFVRQSGRDGEDVPVLALSLSASEESSNSLANEPAGHNVEAAAVGGKVQLPLTDVNLLSQGDIKNPSPEQGGDQSPSELAENADTSEAGSTNKQNQRPISGTGQAKVTLEEPSEKSPALSNPSEPGSPALTDTKATELDTRDLPARADVTPSPAQRPVAGAGELPVSLDGAAAIGRSRHRPEPGLAPSERKLSSRRNGVPQLEMLESRSKPRKGVPAPPQPPEPAPDVGKQGQSSRRTGVPDLDMLENLSKPRKGAPKPGLTVSGSGQSSRRTGVPDLEMLENLSKPRKGAPETGLAVSGSGKSTGRTGVPDLEMFESLSKPRKGATEPGLSVSGSGKSTGRSGVPDLDMLESLSKPRKGAPEPGLSVSGSGQSTGRSGVPDLDMLESLSKPRKGAPEPGLSVSGSGQSTGRSGVPDLDMLESLSKPRKGAPELGASISGSGRITGRTGVPDLEMLETPSKPRKGVPEPPPGWDGSAAGGDGAAGAEPLSEEGAAALTNLAKARAAVIVGSVFGVLSLLVLAWYGVRRVTDSWQHRHYRKMDFLVDGMYNM